MSDTDAILEERLAALRLGFAENLGTRMAALDAAAEAIETSSDSRKRQTALRQLRTLAHKLVGSGTTFGFPEISRISKELEQLCDALIAADAAPDRTGLNRIADMLQALRRATEKPPEKSEDVDLDAEKEPEQRQEEAASWRVLLVEDDNAQARAVIESLKSGRYDIEHADTGTAALKSIDKAPPDAILLDLMLPDIEGIEILRRVADQKLPCTVIVVTAHGSVNLAVEAMRLGAYDFIIKPFNATRLQVTLRNALEHDRLSRIVETYQDLDRTTYFGFVGSSLPMQAVYRIVDSAAGSKATVFVSGESGTGKEVCAEAIHKKSPRNGKPFIALNCGAIPKDLMESEIFGHVKGAFTGAISEREGAAQQANGGTLFLDEVCELDLTLQTKLLRFVQTGTYQKVGGERLEEVDVRFVCATNRDPIAEVAAGRFREDLFYRLHVIPIVLPPLRERGADILTIGRQFLIDFAREEGKNFEVLSEEAEKVFADYFWPGNVREMQNVIRHIVVLNDGPVVTEAMLPPPLGDSPGIPVPAASVVSAPPLPEPISTAAAGDSANADPADAMAGLIRPLADVERETIEAALRLCDGNIPKAAHFLGVSASTIYRKKQNWDDQDGA
jgi:DNA-binding NtrC family response regulator